jgi:hypothetical protein
VLTKTRPRVALPESLASFASGAALALVACGGIVEERVSSGDPGVAVAANLFVTLAAFLVLRALRKGGPVGPGVVASQIAGALCGIAVVHLALRAGVVASRPWLSERPPQLVNDAVAVFSTLALVWACARGMSLRLLAAALLVLAAYRQSWRFWHLDAAPHGFAISVQSFVVAQVVAAAVALVVYQGVSRHAG